MSFGQVVLKAPERMLDCDVTFTDVEGDFDGGTLLLTGLLADETVSVRNEGVGEIGLSGANVTYGGVTIGRLAGGAGTTLIITFNATATSASIDPLIQNLTCANSGDTPIASRVLSLSITVSGAGTTQGTVTVGVTAVNEPTTIAALVSAATANEDSASDLSLAV